MKIIDLQKEKFSELLADFLKLGESFDFANSPSFLQSIYWQEIQEKNNQKVFLKGIESDGKIIGCFLAISKNIFKKYNYWYIPRGPIFFKLDSDLDIWSDFFNIFKKYCRDNKIIFFRLEPLNKNFLKLLKGDKNIFKTKDIQPQETSFLNLNQPIEVLLKNMAQKTRYNIKLAEKKDVQIFDVGLAGFDNFWKLISLTSDRDKFFIHSKKYYLNLISSNNNFIKLFEARAGEKVLASGIFSFYQNTASYLHGASSNEMRNFMAPYLLQWEIIKKAKQEGYKFYDFYGISDKKWPGVTRFKKGFGGKNYSFLGTFDYVFNRPAYFIYNIFRSLNRLIKF
ncbi:MAG TPA: peptidoglycan bridge formation glycyltransferase FemA/FemB family protein [bacterium]|nr:peptidoglycan bridge formation glycyltransferase FemA/FemB family protein [bacterium]